MHESITNTSNDLEIGFDYSSYRSDNLSSSYYYSDNQEQEEQEEQQIDSVDYNDILNDIYYELSDFHADIIVLNDNICGVSQCISDFANVFVELFVIAVFLFMCKAAFDSLLHFFK